MTALQRQSAMLPMMPFRPALPLPSASPSAAERRSLLRLFVITESTPDTGGLSRARLVNAMAGYQIPQSSAAYPLMFFMADSDDHNTGKTGLSPTTTIRKTGGSFASPSGAVSEVGNGWYQSAGNATDTNTIGPLVLHAEASGADTADVTYEVVSGSGGPVEQAMVPLRRVLKVRDRGDGLFDVDGKVRMRARNGTGEALYWALELKGTQLALGELAYGMEEPTLSGDQSSNMTIPAYGVSGTQIKFRAELDSSALTTDDITIEFNVSPDPTEVLLISVPVEVKN